VPHMNRVSFALAALCAVLASAGCGGGGSASSTASPTAAAPIATTEAQREQAALPLAQAAPLPIDLKCSDEIVWVNMSRKTYHSSADPYYGRTINGKYMCLSAADAAGYHKAGMHHAHNHGSMSGGSMGNGTGPTSTP
jgi:hypothetical protein